MQVAQADGVGRADVGDEVVAVRVEQLEGADVVVPGAVDGSVLVLADVDADGQADVAAAGEVGARAGGAGAGEAHGIDQGIVGGQAEDARPRIARLGARRDGADLDVAEAERGQRAEGDAILIEAAGQAERATEAEAQALDGEGRIVVGEGGAEDAAECRRAAGAGEQGQDQLVGALGVELGGEREEQSAVEEGGWGEGDLSQGKSPFPSRRPGAGGASPS